jgi:hypothetical protein
MGAGHAPAGVGSIDAWSSYPLRNPGATGPRGRFGGRTGHPRSPRRCPVTDRERVF